MSDNTMTIALEGDVLLSQFSEAMRHFFNLIDLLSREVAEDTQIEWFIDDLQTGSAIATIAGIADDNESVQKVIYAYGDIGKSLQKHKPIRYSKNVAKEAISITGLLNGNITAVRFETAESDSIIYSLFDEESPRTVTQTVSFGTIKGRVQSMSNRKGLRFTIYDPLFDKGISCYLEKGQESFLKEIWGQTISVTGRIVREPDNGRPFKVRDITSIDPVKIVEPGSYRVARGIFFDPQDKEPAEISIRRIRDAEN